MDEVVTISKPVYTLRQLVLYFLKLGYAGFGGPVALIGYMYKDLVEERKWITEEEYKDGLALAQLAPGPLAAQLGIYLGFVHYRVLGATLCGLAFVLPSFFMVVAIGIAYKMFGGLPWMQAVFYGVGAAVVGIIGISSYRLTEKSISKFSLKSFADKWMLWMFFVLAAIITIATEQEEVLLFVVASNAANCPPAEKPSTAIFAVSMLNFLALACIHLTAALRSYTAAGYNASVDNL